MTNSAETEFTFPFGQKVHTVHQVDCTPKDVFVLGVYASAVHAKWVSQQQKTVVQALAVASEPYIFWRGENAEELVAKISIPSELGILYAAKPEFNGPSGRTLDELYLNVLSRTRDKAWLCDLLPQTRLNAAQLNAIKKYNRHKKRYLLADVTVPSVPKEFAEEGRRNEIAKEIETANPNLIVLLGDQPIRFFLSAYTSQTRLSDFVKTKKDYGHVFPVNINGKQYSILPLVHPRQAGGLGRHSSEWYECIACGQDEALMKLKKNIFISKKHRKCLT